MGGPNNPCPPKSACWCEQHPNHPACKTGVPINNGLIFLLIAGLVLGILKLNSNRYERSR